MEDKTLAMRGEEAAARYLESRGYEVMERNYLCEAGACDIIAKDEKVIAFIEVRTYDGYFDDERIDGRKRSRYERIALAYLAENESIVGTAVRFDIISIAAVGRDRALLKHHVNAFGVE